MNLLLGSSRGGTSMFSKMMNGEPTSSQSTITIRAINQVLAVMDMHEGDSFVDLGWPKHTTHTTTTNQPFVCWDISLCNANIVAFVFLLLVVCSFIVNIVVVVVVVVVFFMVGLFQGLGLAM